MSARIGSCKLSYGIINKLMMPKIFIKDKTGNAIEINNVTNAELNLLLQLSLLQDPWGNVKGVYYKDIALNLGYKSMQTFYNAIKGLEIKGYIKINYNNDKFWACKILDNKFVNSKDDKKGYFNTNKEFLHTPAFRKLKVNEMKLCIKLAMSYHEQHFEKFGLQIYPKKMAKWIGIKSQSLIYRYMENINQFFPNIRKNGIQGELIYFPKGNNTPFITKVTEKEHYLSHKIKYFCREFKIAYTIKDLKDLIILISQYANKGISKLYNVINNVLLNYKSIEPALINSILSS